MSIWSDFDPTGNNFLGLGPKRGRILVGILSSGGSEFSRTDPLATTPGTTLNKIGRGVGGVGPGAVGGFVTGGIPGAIAGGVGGGVAGGTGLTNSTKLSGIGEDMGIGAGMGGLAGYAAGSGLFAGGGASAGGSAMTPYMPTSTPVMSQMGSTLGPGMGSPLNLGPASGSAQGAAAGSPVASSTPSSVDAAFRWIRGMSPSGSQQQPPAQQSRDVLATLYQMFPGLRPGAQMGQGINIGGGFGG